MSAIRFVVRLILMITVIYSLLAVFLIVRIFEWPFGRKLTPEITRLVCNLCLKIMGITQKVQGTPMKSLGSVVANHSSWIDIFVLNASQRIFFVSKSEVRNWFGIGILGRVTGTVFIERRMRQSLVQKGVFFERLQKGDKLLFFPEGTSTDGQQVDPFKSTLFAALFEPELKDLLSVQPVSVYYKAPKGQDPRLYAWWGELNMVQHLQSVLSAPGNGSVSVTYHEPIKVSDHANRKELAKKCEDIIRHGHEDSRETA
ncbi:MAG: lysophospholipid acyltransferase family protein [Rhodobacteraceae bacterium]|nr:lysophospholipid acyltransferase family protein [Paracoccaceae bacterium]